MKTQEEFKELKQEYASLTAKLKELTEDELDVVTGGSIMKSDIDIRKDLYENIILGGNNSEEKCTNWNTHNGILSMKST